MFTYLLWQVNDALREHGHRRPEIPRVPPGILVNICYIICISIIVYVQYVYIYIYIYAYP